MSNLEYEPDERIEREQLVRNLKSSNPRTVAKALYSAARYEPDTEWIEEECLSRLTSPELEVRWAAAVCLGDMAFCRRPLDVDKVIPALEVAARDPTIAMHAQDSLDMVREFLT
jgi:hypothetical protein